MRAFLERMTYVALGVSALLAAIPLVPGMLGEVQLIDRVSVETFAMSSVVVLGIPWVVAVLVAILLTIVHAVKGPSDVRRRLVLWYLLAPGLVTLGYAAGSRAAEAGATQAGGVFFILELVFAGMVIAALLIGSILPFVWLFKNRKKAEAQGT
jgi:hypothetical protein